MLKLASKGERNLCVCLFSEFGFLLNDIVSILVLSTIQHPRQKHMIIVAELDESLLREDFAPDRCPEALAIDNYLPQSCP